VESCIRTYQLDIEALSDIEGFAFGFPCNDYSLVGEWKGLRGEFGPLYSYGVKVLASKTPRWFVAENVSGLGAPTRDVRFARY
jgi:DNA (cytosine-5)-methyltransferase 1